MPRTLLYVGPADDVTDLLYAAESVAFVRVDNMREARLYLLRGEGVGEPHLIGYSVQVACRPDAAPLEAWHSVVLCTDARPSRSVVAAVGARSALLLPAQWPELLDQLAHDARAHP